VAERTVERIKRNNGIFKDANEAIDKAAEAYEHDLDQVPFLCECPVEYCFEIVRLTRDEYAAIREDANLYVVAVGHESAEEPVGRVVQREDGYIVVEKA
jgi:hypothetical protein